MSAYMHADIDMDDLHFPAESLPVAVQAIDQLASWRLRLVCNPLTAVPVRERNACMRDMGERTIVALLER